eukprot:Sro157_g071370.2  (450) ;mRNA; f:93326-94675
MLSSWAWTLYMFFSLALKNNEDSIPLLLATSEQELNAIKESHGLCLESLCQEIGRGIDVDCVVNEDGKTGRTEFGANVPSQIFFPKACHDATEATLGFPFLDGDEEMGIAPVAFISVAKDPNMGQNETVAMLEAQKSLLTLLPECAIVVNAAAPVVSQEEMESIKESLKFNNNDHGEWDKLFEELNQQEPQPLEMALTLDLLSLTSQQQYTPGHRETHVLKKLFCPEDMPPEVQQKVIPTLQVIYTFFMDYRIEMLIMFLFASHSVLSVGTVCWLVVRLILPAMLMKKFLSWPHHASNIISFWDIWRTLILLCMVSSYGLSSPVLSVVLALGAWVLCGDTTAAMEWAFLGCLAWSADDMIFPFLDTWVGDPMSQIKGMRILNFVINSVVVGEGWWKLVTIYVIAKSYQGLNAKQRQSSKNALEQTQINLQGVTNHNGPTAVNGEHAKMD